MTGTDDERLGDGLDMASGDIGLWVPGVDYITGWREARTAAERLDRAFLAVGFELSELRAVASAYDDGRGVVRFVGWHGAAVRLAQLLEERAVGDGGAS